MLETQKPWSKLGSEDWAKVKFCGECGLPLITDEGTAKTKCVYCSKIKEQEEIARQTIAIIERERQESINNVLSRERAALKSHKKEVDALKEQISWKSTRRGDRPAYGIQYEVCYDGFHGRTLGFATFNEPGYWVGGIEPLFFRVVQIPML